MKIESHILHGVRIAEVVSKEVLIKTIEDAIDLLGNLYYQDFDSIIIQVKNLAPEFFDLKNGMAGEILQKFSNYRVRLAIIGDFSVYPGNSVREFISESNRKRQINFVATKTEALDALSEKG